MTRTCRTFGSSKRIAIVESTRRIHSGDGEAEEIYGLRGPANLLDLLGVRPALGRAFVLEEDQSGRGEVVLLTDSFWRSRFHGDSAVIGRAIALDDEPHVIAGVLPASFHFPKKLTGSGRPVAFHEPLDGSRSYESSQSSRRLLVTFQHAQQQASIRLRLSAASDSA